MKFLGFLKKHIKLWIVLIIVIAIVIYARYSIKKAQEALEAAANEPVTSSLSVMDLQKSVSVTGTLTANDLKTVTSSIGGTGLTGVKVSKVNYKEGDYVEAGTVVVEFDGDDYNRKIAELNAQYNIEDLKSAQSISDLQKSIADYQEKIVDAQKWLDDYKLYYDNLLDAQKQYKKYPNDPDTAERYRRETTYALNAYNLSIEGYEAKEKELKSYKDAIEAAQNNIQIAQLQQNYSQTYTQVDAKDDVYESMEKTQVSAPFSGYIITMNVEEGNNYQTGSTVFTIADTSGYVVEATVNEYDVASIKQGLPAVVKFEATGDEEFKGEVTYVSLASEATLSGTNAAASAMAATGTAGGTTATDKVKIKLTDNDERLRVGMTAKASVVLDSVSNVFAVPYDCVQEKDDGSFFINEILEDGTKKEIPVKKGLESDYYVEITGEGLKDGMTVEAIVSDAPSTDVMDYITFD